MILYIYNTIYIYIYALYDHNIGGTVLMAVLGPSKGSAFAAASQALQRLLKDDPGSEAFGFRRSCLQVNRQNITKTCVFCGGFEPNWVVFLWHACSLRVV